MRYYNSKIATLIESVPERSANLRNHRKIAKSRKKPINSNLESSPNDEHKNKRNNEKSFIKEKPSIDNN